MVLSAYAQRQVFSHGAAHMPTPKSDEDDNLVFYIPFIIFNPGPSWTQICPVFANSAAPAQLASEEANWSGSALFVIKYVDLHQQPGSSNLIDWIW